MTIDTLASWHRLVHERNIKGLDALLSENVVFYSPVLHTPQVGKTLTTQYLTAAFQVLGDKSFRYVRELSGDHDAILEFQVEVDGISINGVDMIKWDGSGQIVEFKALIRPLKAIDLLQKRMVVMLRANPQDG